MRTTRAYLAGFGTAGSILAGAAVLFVIASAVVAFQGWPKVASQGTPATVEIRGGGPVAGSRVSRRLHAVTTSVNTRRGPVAHGQTAPHSVPGGAAGPRARAGRLGSGSARSGSRASGRRSRVVSLSTPTKPPVTVRVPTRPVTHTVGRVLRTSGRALKRLGQTVATVVRNVSSATSFTVQP